MSFFTSKDCGHTVGLMDLLRKAGQDVPEQLESFTKMTAPPKIDYAARRRAEKAAGIKRRR